MNRYNSSQSLSPEGSSTAPSRAGTYVNSLCGALGQDFPGSSALPPAPQPTRPVDRSPFHLPVSETNTAQQAECSSLQSRSATPVQQPFLHADNRPFSTPANWPCSSPSKDAWFSPFNDAYNPPFDDAYPQPSDYQYNAPPNRSDFQPYNDPFPSPYNDPFPAPSNDQSAPPSIYSYPLSSSSLDPFPPFYNQPSSSSANGPFIPAPTNWPSPSSAIDEYYINDTSGPSSLTTHHYDAADADTQPYTHPAAESYSSFDTHPGEAPVYQHFYDTRYRPGYGPPMHAPSPASVPIPDPEPDPASTSTSAPAPSRTRAPLGSSIHYVREVIVPARPAAARPRVIRLPLPPDTCLEYSEPVYVRGKLGLRCRACPDIRRTPLNKYVAENVDGADAVMDSIFPDASMYVHRGLFACDPSPVYVFNSESRKSPREHFTLAHLLTMIVSKQYKAWYQKKFKAKLDLQKIVGANREPYQGTAVSYGMIYIVAIRRWRDSLFRWHYFPELEIRT